MWITTLNLTVVKQFHSIDAKKKKRKKKKKKKKKKKIENPKIYTNLIILIQSSEFL